MEPKLLFPVLAACLLGFCILLVDFYFKKEKARKFDMGFVQFLAEVCFFAAAFRLQDLYVEMTEITGLTNSFLTGGVFVDFLLPCLLVAVLIVGAHQLAFSLHLSRIQKT